jgi:hypothetical protein
MKEQACIDLVEDKWTNRAEDLKNPDFEALGFDWVEPNTFTDQREGYWRWQFSWGGPSDELRGYINWVPQSRPGALHRLEYWYLDWGDGACHYSYIGRVHCILGHVPRPRSCWHTASDYIRHESRGLDCSAVVIELHLHCIPDQACGAIVVAATRDTLRKLLWKNN